MRLRFVRTIAVSALVAFAGCSDATAPQSDVLRVTRTFNGIVLHNLVGVPVHYAVIEEGTLAITDFLLCSDPSCPAVAAGKSLAVGHAQISGYHSGARKAVVLHWLLRRGGGLSYQPDELRKLVVPL